MNFIDKKTTPKCYKAITLQDLSKLSDPEIYVQINGTDISLEVALLDEETSNQQNAEQLLELYYQYLVQGKKNGSSTPYLETQLKNIRSLLKDFFKHASDTTFRILTSIQ